MTCTAQLRRLVAITIVLAACVPEREASAPKPVSTNDYDVARRYLFENKSNLILNDSVMPNWIGEGGEFWYLRSPAPGEKEFVRVDPATGEKVPAFDHDQIATEVTRLTGEETFAASLPFDTFQYSADEGISFVAHSMLFQCGNEECLVSESPVPTVNPGETSSPDGQWAVYFRNNNLWIRALDGSSDSALTADGEADDTYGISTGTDLSPISRQRLGLVDAPIVSFSPNGKYLLTQRIDQRAVGELHLLHQSPADGYRPILYSIRYAMALDEHKPLAKFVVIDLETRKQRMVDYPSVKLALVPHLHPAAPEAFWLPDSDAFVFVHRHENGAGYSINRVDVATGEVKKIVERQAERTAFPSISSAIPAQVRPVGDSGVVWYSDESGWGHLFFTDFGGVTRQLTSGDWNVVSILAVDDENNDVYFTRSLAESEGNPYHLRLAKTSLDANGSTDLTPEPAVHRITPAHLSPNRAFIVDNFSSTSNPGQSLLRRVNGDVVAELESADVSRIDPEVLASIEDFEVLAADGETRLWGRLIKPPGFSPQDSYPVVDFIYPGPQSNRVSHAYSDIRSCGLFDFANPVALAQLGFVTLCVDGRGTPGRSPAFNYDSDKSLLGEAGYLDDHVAAIRQLAETRRWMNLDAVGITGHSGGGYASTHALLEHPEFFKVAVSSAGNHEQRSYLPIWGESYLGADDGENYSLASNPDLAENLQGKLLLMFGAMDDNVHPTQTYQLINSLIAADKSFDVVILPNAAHRYSTLDAGEAAYATRRTWDYFVEHLLGATPPGNQ